MIDQHHCPARENIFITKDATRRDKGAEALPLSKSKQEKN